MDWGKSYTTSWRLFRVDPSTWEDAGEVEGVTSVEVEQTTDQLLQTATVHVDAEEPDGFEPGWYRLSCAAWQDGGATRVDVFTGLLEGTGADSLGADGWDIELEGRSVLQPAKDVLLSTGSYAPKGADGAAYAASMLQECTPAPVEVEGASPALNSNVVFDTGDSTIEAVWAILDACGWVMQVDGGGFITIKEKPTEPVALIDDSWMANERSYERDRSEVSNRYIAIEDGYTATATDTDPDSPTSYTSRGRWVDVVDDSVKRTGGETLAAYAQRKLSEATAVGAVHSYSRCYMPDIYPFDIVRWRGVDMRITSQTLECGAGIEVSEEAEEI